MSVILKAIPGVPPKDLLDALSDIQRDFPGATWRSGHGGIETDERTAYEFLRAYLVATGAITSDVSAPSSPTRKQRRRKGVTT